MFDCKQKMKYGFYISGKSTRLKKFLLNEKRDLLEQIKIVISDEYIDTSLKKILEDNRIKYAEHCYKDFGGITREEKNEQLSDYLKKELDINEVDYCFSFGKHILNGELLNYYKNRIINFHPSILPMYPGLYAIDQAIKDEKVFLIGNTAHFVDEGIDTGQIIMQSVLPIQAFYDSNADYDLVLDLQIDMLHKIMELLNENRILDEGDKGKVRIIGADYKKAVIFPNI